MIGVVKRKNTSPHVGRAEMYRDARPKARKLRLEKAACGNVLSMVERVCKILEFHDRELRRYFIEKDVTEEVNPLITLKPNLSEFLKLLDSIFKMCGSKP